MITIINKQRLQDLLQKEKELKSITTYEKQAKTAVKHCYTDKNGNRYYEFENIFDLKAIRATAAEVAAKEMSMGLTVEQLQQAFDKMTEHINNDQFAEHIHLLREVRNRLFN